MLKLISFLKLYSTQVDLTTFFILILLVETKCYVLDLAQSPKTWETFPELPQPCAYPAMTYNEKVNRLYVVGCENQRYDEHPWVNLMNYYLLILQCVIKSSKHSNCKLKTCIYLGWHICVRF